MLDLSSPAVVRARALKSRVKHNKFGEGVVMRYEAEKVVVQFDTEGEKSMLTQAVLDNALMSTVT